MRKLEAILDGGGIRVFSWGARGEWKRPTHGGCGCGLSRDTAGVQPHWFALLLRNPSGCELVPPGIPEGPVVPCGALWYKEVVWLSPFTKTRGGGAGTGPRSWWLTASQEQSLRRRQLDECSGRPALPGALGQPPLRGTSSFPTRPRGAGRGGASSGGYSTSLLQGWVIFPNLCLWGLGQATSYL